MTRPLLHLVLAEAALELVPEPLWSHPAVSKSARARRKSPGEILLDDTHHHAAMRALAKKGAFAEPERRGRPDIVHLSLLVALESRLNRAGRLRVWLHTRDDRWITIDPAVHVQRAQHRFTGLMENLLLHGRVPPEEKGNPLLSVQEGVPLAAGIRRTGATRVLVLDEKGEVEDDGLEGLLTDVPPGGDVAAVVGAYPRGELKNDLSVLPVTTIRLGNEPVPAWTIVSEIVVRGARALAPDAL